MTDTLQKLLACAVALTLSLSSRSPVAAEKPDEDLADTILSHVGERLPPSEARSVSSQKFRVRSFTRQVATASYYPLTLSKSRDAAVSAIDAAANPSATASTLVRAAMSAVLDSLGHGARMIPPANELPRAHDIHLQKPSPRTVGDIRVVSVPQFVIPQEVWAPPCRGLEGYFEVPASERISGIVVDLRGNEGGLLDAPVCLVSIFIKPNVEIFETADTKRRYGSRSVRVGEHGHTPLAYPLAIFVDKTTDEGALMAAAILQDQRRARIIGEIKSEIAGSVCTLFRTDKDQDIFLLPVGQLLLPGGRPLATAIRLDVLVPAHDDAALIDAARAQFALARETQP